MPLTIDAHHHFWQLDRYDYAWLEAEALEPIRRNYLPADLQANIAEAGVDKTVFVQTRHNTDETKWVLELSEQNDFLIGVVGWVDLASPNCEDQLLELKQHLNFVGVRHVTHDEPDDDFIVRPEVINGLKVLQKHNVPFDLLFFVKHLKHAKTLGRELPDLPMVIDHISKPLIKEGKTEGWIDDLKAAAEFPNMYCKLSGMITEADWKNWKPADLKPYIDQTLELFGPERCMFGTDWPVCELAGTYKEVYDSLVEVTADLSDSEKNLIFGETAAKFYGLRV